MLPSADGRTASTPSVLPASASVSGTGSRGHRPATRRCGRRRCAGPTPGRRAGTRRRPGRRPTGSHRTPLTRDVAGGELRPARAASRGRSPSAGTSTTNTCSGPVAEEAHAVRPVLQLGDVPRVLAAGLAVGRVATLLRDAGHVGDAGAVRGEPRLGRAQRCVREPDRLTAGRPRRRAPAACPRARPAGTRPTARPGSPPARCPGARASADAAPRAALEIDRPQLADVLVGRSGRGGRPTRRRGCRPRGRPAHRGHGGARDR